MVQSDQNIKDYINRRLGSGVVGVELTNDQLEDALDDAKMFFQTYIGQHKETTISGVNEGGNFNMPADCDEVVEVIWDVRDADLYDQFDWAGVELGPLNFGMYGGYSSNGSVGGGYSYLVQAVNYRDQAKRVLGLDRDWLWNREIQKLALFPSGSGGRGIGDSVLVRYMSRGLDVTVLRPFEYNLLRKYSYAESLEILANIRTKYNDLPSASGSITLNGDTLFSNSETIKAEIAEQIKMLRPTTPFFAG